MMNTTTRTVLFLLGLVSTGYMGCGAEQSPLEGVVKFEGKTVRSGYILFRPDEQTGQRGPSCRAQIYAGKFMIPAGTTFTPGPTIAEIVDKSQPDANLIARFDFPSRPDDQFEIVAEVDQSKK